MGNICEHWEDFQGEGEVVLLEIGEFSIHFFGLKATQAEYDVPFFQFACGLSLAIEETKDGKGCMGTGKGIKMFGNHELPRTLVDREVKDPNCVPSKQIFQVSSYSL